MASDGFCDKTGAGGAEYTFCEALLNSGAPHCFSTRRGGVSTGYLESLNLGTGRNDSPENLIENYKRICGAAGLPRKIAFTRQVHGNRVDFVGPDRVFAPENARNAPECDGLLTMARGFCLCGFFADCIPILLYAPKAGVCGVVHAGWRGTALGIAAAAVRAAEGTAGVAPEEWIAAIGPGICPRCFETDGDVPAAMEKGLGGLALPHIGGKPGEEGRFFVDLKGINASALKAAGVREVHICGECTCHAPEKYFSHRRDGAKRGSLAALIALP